MKRIFGLAALALACGVLAGCPNPNPSPSPNVTTITLNPIQTKAVTVTVIWVPNRQIQCDINYPPGNFTTAGQSGLGMTNGAGGATLTFNGVPVTDENGTPISTTVRVTLRTATQSFPQPEVSLPSADTNITLAYPDVPESAPSPTP